MIRKNCCVIARAYWGNSPRLTKCNCLAGYRVQPAPTRYRGGFKFQNPPQPAPVRGVLTPLLALILILSNLDRKRIPLDRSDILSITNLSTTKAL